MVEMIAVAMGATERTLQRDAPSCSFPPTTKRAFPLGVREIHPLANLMTWRNLTAELSVSPFTITHWNFPTTIAHSIYLYNPNQPNQSSIYTQPRQHADGLHTMSRMSKAQKLMLDATRAPVEPTPLMKLVRLPIIDSVSRLKNGDGSVVLSSDVKSLEMRYYPKHSSNGVKWVSFPLSSCFRGVARERSRTRTWIR